MLQGQTARFNDFSGGLTENFLPGAHSRYLAADNLILIPGGDGSAHLLTRPGSQVIDTTNARLPTGNQRVSDIVNFDTDTTLLAFSGKKIYQYAAGPTWSSLLGPTSNDPFAGASAATIHRSSMWNHILFAVADSGDLPLKIYRDGAGLFVTKSAGLPVIPATANVSSADLLTNLIALAVELRTQMMAHYNHYENAGADNTKQHVAKHTTAYDALDAWVTPTTLATLITAVNLLTTHYTAHIDDAQLMKNYYASGSAQTYHRNRTSTAFDVTTTFGNTNFGQYPILNFDLDPAISIGTTLETVRVRLNDLRMRWNMHTYALLTHGTTSTYGQHKSTVAEVTNTSGPVINPNLDFLIHYAAQLKIAYNGHVGDAARHTIADTVNTVSPTGTDKETLIIELAHLEHAYWQHSLDADYSTAGVARTYNVCYGTPVDTNNTMTITTADAATKYAVGYYFTRNADQTAPPLTWRELLLTAGGQTHQTPWTAGSHTIAAFPAADQIQMSANAWGAGWGGSQAFVFSASKYHHNFNNSATAVSYSINAQAAIHGMDPAFSLTSLCAAFIAFKAKFLAHHTSTGGGWAGSDTTGALYPPHEYSNVAGSIPVLSDYNTNATLLGYTPQVANYNYQFILMDSYSVGTVNFEDRGPGMASPIAVETVMSPFASTSDNDAANYPLYVGSIPVLANSTTKNYATGTVKVEVYRTGNALTNYYKVGEVTNGTTTFTDDTIDANLPEGVALYTNGGVVDNDPPPIAKAIALVDRTMYYGNIVDAGETLPNRVRQSIADDPDSCPGDFYVDLDSPVTWISSFRNVPIVGCVEGIYRLSGGFDELGRGALVRERISNIAGSNSPRSAVQTEYGVFFAGIDSFYWTDGYQVTKLTEELNATFTSYTQNSAQKNAIHGTYDPIGKRVLWQVQSTTDGTTDLTFVMDLRWPSRPFTTWSNGVDWKPSCMGWFAGQLYRGDERGYVLKHASSYTTDPKIDTSTGAANWVTKVVRYNYMSCGMDFGTSEYRKWVTRVNLSARDEGNLSLQINSINDNGRSFSNLKPIRFRGNSPDQGTSALIVTPPNGSETFAGLIDEWRRFVAGTLRCNYKQIQLTTSWAIITNSDTLGLANFDGTANTITLVNGANSWPTDPVDYAIAIETDGYVIEWVVATRTSATVLTLSDPGGTLPTVTNKKWVLRGYPKGEKLHLLSYGIQYALLGKAPKDYAGGTTEGGENA